MLFKLSRANKSISPISFEDAWNEATGRPEDISYVEIYHTVPLVNRAINLIATNMASLPYSWYRADRELQVVPSSLREFDADLPHILTHIIQSLWIYGSCYLLPIENKVGMNRTLDALSTNDISIVHSGDGSVSHFLFSFYSTTERLYPDECVFIWLNNPVHTNYPGISPLRASYLAGYSLYNLDAFTQRFFKNGAIRATLLKVGSDNPLSQMPTREEVSRLQRLWNNLLTGTRNAFRNLVVTNEVTTIPIGEGLKEIDFAGITESRQRDIAVGLGVPHSLLYDNSANYATMQQAYLSFYTNTLLPAAEMIEKELNAQYLLPTFGYSLKFRPEKLEVFQSSEFEKAQKVLLLQDFLTRNEIREAFGYAPEDTLPVPSDTGTKAARIPTSVVERALYSRLLEVFSPQLDAATQAILRGENFDYSKLSEELQAALLPFLSSIYIDKNNNLVAETGIPIPVERLSTASSQWAREHSYDLIKELDSTTRQVVQGAIGDFVNTPGMTRGDVESRLQIAFSPSRASSIVITETTRAAARTVEDAQKYYKEELNLTYKRKWNTSNSDKNCPICAPLNGKFEDEIEETIPAHPNCECFWTLVLQEQKDT